VVARRFFDALTATEPTAIEAPEGGWTIDSMLMLASVCHAAALIRHSPAEVVRAAESGSYAAVERCGHLLWNVAAQNSKFLGEALGKGSSDEPIIFGPLNPENN
jgi:hypothetical protein